MNKKIAAVVVTYNRKELLLKCLDAIVSQIFKPQIIYIVDNASTDGTFEAVEKYKSNIPVKYILLEKNIGGAGGFYTGIKNAYEDEYFDGFWVMDDDGIPEINCLKCLCENLSYNFVAPLVLSIENDEEVAFPYLPEKTHMQIIQKYGDSGIIKDYANPFNGILLSNEFVKKVGYPKKEMFIWGDEDEYQHRAIYLGFPPITLVNAIHKHPKDRMRFYKDFLGRDTIIYVDSRLRRYCKYRNTAYTVKKYTKSKIATIVYQTIKYLYYYLFSRKFDIKGLRLFIRATIDGLKEDFSKHFNYI